MQLGPEVGKRMGVLVGVAVRVGVGVTVGVIVRQNPPLHKAAYTGVLPAGQRPEAGRPQARCSSERGISQQSLAPSVGVAVAVGLEVGVEVGLSVGVGESVSVGVGVTVGVGVYVPHCPSPRQAAW